MTRRYYAVLASVSRSYPPLKGRLVTCYSPVRHFTHGLLHFLVRLACVRHAASVDSEPGSNSHLKPVVCRRVVGRLPPHPRKAWWIYLVRSLGFQPKPSSHDWHVQPSCQRTDPLPPERALSVQSQSALTQASRVYTNLPVLETCTSYAFVALTVNPLLAQDIHLFSTTGEASRLFI